MMTAATSFGFDSIETWLAFNSVVLAFMRFAKKRSKSGAIAPSRVDTTYHDGLVFHATLDTLVAKAEVLMGPWVAATTRASAGGRSDAKSFTTASDQSGFRTTHLASMMSDLPFYLLRRHVGDFVARAIPLALGGQTRWQSTPRRQRTRLA